MPADMQLQVKDEDAVYVFTINDNEITKVEITYDPPLPLRAVLTLPHWRLGGPTRPVSPSFPERQPPQPPRPRFEPRNLEPSNPPAVLDKDGRELCPNCGVPLVPGTCKLGDPVMKCPRCGFMRRRV